MIYSQWSHDGNYNYYEYPLQLGIGNDLALPQIPSGTEIGTSAQVCGRTIPVGAKLIGKGQEPIGLMSPSHQSLLKGMDGLSSVTADKTFYLLIAAGIGVTALSFLTLRKL